MWCVRTSTSTRTPTTPWPCDLDALVPELLRRPLDGSVVGHRGDDDLPLPPVPHSDGHGDDRDATDQIDRLPAGPVQEQRLVDGEVGGHAPRPWRAAQRWRATWPRSASRPWRRSPRRRSCEPHRGPGRRHDVEVLEAAHAISPQGAVDDLVALGQLALDHLDPGAVQQCRPRAAGARACGPAVARPCAPCSPARPRRATWDRPNPGSPPSGTRSCSRPTPAPRPWWPPRPQA